jgi:hypothetical protein
MTGFDVACMIAAAICVAGAVFASALPGRRAVVLARQAELVPA